jgi:hypothetical protein
MTGLLARTGPIITELKAVKALEPGHEQQLLNYMHIKSTEQSDTSCYQTKSQNNRPSPMLNYLNCSGLQCIRSCRHLGSCGHVAALGSSSERPDGIGGVETFYS